LVHLITDSYLEKMPKNGRKKGLLKFKQHFERIQ
jgi:hypothetical protein